MNLWSVPPAPNTDLGGICVYDHPRDDRVFNRYAESVVSDMTIQKCEEDCFEKGHGELNSYLGFGYLLKLFVTTYK